MKTITIKIFLFTLSLLTFTYNAVSQMNYWTLPDNYIDMNNLNVAPVAGGLGFSYTGANGAYDSNGSLLFYVKSEQSGVYIVDPSGTTTLLNSLDYAGQQVTFPLQEIAIVPVPQSCLKYYVIWLGSAPVLAGVALGYAIVDCATGVSVSTNTTHLDSWGANVGGIAVTKAPAGLHYLLVAERDKLVRSSITATGINNNLTIANNISAPCFSFPGVETFELEVSQDGQKVLMADWVTPTGPSKVYELWFNPDVYHSSPTVAQTTYNYPNNGTTGFGLEYNFDASRIFVSTNIINNTVGLYWINSTNSGGNLNPISASSTYSQSHLEYGLNNYIYAVDNNGNLGKIDNINNGTPFVSTAGIGVTILGNANSYPAGISIFSLPDQIDGEIYTNFFTPPPPVVGFNVNNIAVSSTIPLDICITNPILMNTVTTTATNYNISIYNSTPTGGQGTLISSTGWINNPLPSIVDLQNLPNSAPNGTWLGNANNVGYYLVLLEVQNDCAGTTTFAEGLLNVLNVNSDFIIPLGCNFAGQSVNFSANQPFMPGITYNWIFDSGTPNTSNNQNESVFWSASGAYNITLNVAHTSGCISSTTQTLSIEDLEVCCNEDNSWNVLTYSAQPITETWDSGTNPFGVGTVVYIKDALIIPTNSHITINNMILHFGLTGRVIIQKGGSLNLNGTILTGNDICQTMWIGVTVEGDAGNTDFSSQGQFTMNTYGLIQSQIDNAMVSVLNWDLFTLNYSSTGGYFNLNNAIFSNCYMGINKYLVDNTTDQCIINNCDFLGTNTLLYPFLSTRTKTFIYLESNFNSSVQFFGSNHFSDSEIGITSFDSKFDINGSFFVNCKKGIASSKIDPGFTSNHTFTSNFFIISQLLFN
ncbi:MAG: PKD domain-containing protein [Bacteroidetes bacterium]|nr:PKD domain-containing protein [Bacteroidota bacterium]